MQFKRTLFCLVFFVPFVPLWLIPLPPSALCYNARMQRLNKYLAHAGVGSRRFCETLIAAGRVKIDGVRVTDLGVKVDPNAHKVSVDDPPVRVKKPVYWAVNKPIGYLCTNADP